MGKINSFEDLEVWQNASELAVDTYILTSKGKLEKDFGLKDQFQRASISISNNIAEGFEYDNNKDFIKYLRYSKGSAGEVRNMINFLRKINYIDEKDFKIMYEKLVRLSKQLKTFINYLKDYENRKKT
jgi:four helix bundle protein